MQKIINSNRNKPVYLLTNFINKKRKKNKKKKIWYLARLARLAASRCLRFFSSCLFSKNLLLLHSWMTPAFITSRRNLLSSLSSPSSSPTTTWTLYADRKNNVFEYAKEGHTTEDSSSQEGPSRRGVVGDAELWEGFIILRVWEGSGDDEGRFSCGGDGGGDGCLVGNRKERKLGSEEVETAIELNWIGWGENAGYVIWMKLENEWNDTGNLRFASRVCHPVTAKVNG